MESIIEKLCRGGYVCESKKEEIMRMLSEEIMLPWCGVEKKGNCVNIKKNGGLYTQCEGKAEEGVNCKVCGRSKNVKKYGEVSDRLKSGIMEYVDPSSGKKPKSYMEYMRKNNIRREDVERYGKMCGIIVPEIHFEEEKKTRGRPKKEKVEGENEEKKKRGRPKKEKQVVSNGAGEELIASLLMESRVENKVESQVGSQVGSHVENKVGSHVENKVESQVEKKVESNVEKKVESNVEKKVESNVEKKVESNVEKKVGSQVGSQVESQVGSQVESNVEKKVESNVEKKVESQVEESDDEEETIVVKFDIKGITYLKSKDNVLYDMLSHDVVGLWNEERAEIEEIVEESEEE
jgi:hypothetical protein